jgi:hypothetical protein
MPGEDESSFDNSEIGKSEKPKKKHKSALFG